MEKRTRFRKMYLAAFCALLSAASMGLVAEYSAPATYDMAYRESSAVKPNQNEITWIGSIVALGAMFAGVFAGTIADKIGRKNTLLFSMALLIAGWLIIGYAKVVIIIIIGRFLCGFACGFITASVPVYCVEISTMEVRGILGSSFQLFVTIGSLLIAVIGSYISWESLALYAAGFTTFSAICFYFMPESPQWLLAKGRLEEAILVMDKLQSGYIDAKSECISVQKDLQCQSNGSILSFKECKHPKFYKPALISVFLMFFQQASGINSILFYSSEIFETAKYFIDPQKATIILGAVQVVGTLISNLIVDKVGRKILLILSQVFMSLSLIFLGIYYFVSSTDANFQKSNGWISLVSLIVFIFAFSSGFGALPWLLSSEMVSVRARSTISGIATFSNGLLVFTVAKTFSDIENLISNYGIFWTYSCLSLVGIVFVFFFVPETKGKKLEDIEKMFYTNVKELDNSSTSHKMPRTACNQSKENNGKSN